VLPLNTRIHSYTKIAYLFHDNESHDREPDSSTELLSIRMIAITATSKSTALASSFLAASTGGFFFIIPLSGEFFRIATALYQPVQEDGRSILRSRTLFIHLRYGAPVRISRPDQFSTFPS
ncbi:hypothetical protein CORC01_11099, partial [Colletotrichum orchidophilum]